MTDGETGPTYEELALIEEEFEAVDTEIIKKQYLLSAPIYAKRQTLVARIEHFWALVLEQAPPEISPAIQVADSQLFSEALTSLEVRRFEIHDEVGKNGKPDGTGKDPVRSEGNPRSFSVKMTFAKDNAWFSDTELEKKFWYRRAKDGWTGLVSEPVKINWKKGKDLTQGVTDLAVALFEARKKSSDYSAKDIPEYFAFAKKLEKWQQTSFMGFFAFTASRRFVSAEESEEAWKEEEVRRERRRNGETVEVPSAEAQIDEIDDCAEVLEQAEDIAICIAEDVWPSANKYFLQAQEDVDEEMSDANFEDDESDDDDEGKPVDIRALVGKGRGEDKSVSPTPPKKKQKS